MLVLHVLTLSVVPLLRAILFANTFVRVDLHTIAFKRFVLIAFMSCHPVLIFFVMLSRVATLCLPLCRDILSPVTSLRINLFLFVLSCVTTLCLRLHRVIFSSVTLMRVDLFSGMILRVAMLWSRLRRVILSPITFMRNDLFLIMFMRVVILLESF